MEAPVVAQAERHAGLLGGGDGRFRVRFRQRKRLLAEDVLAGLRRRDDLRAVQRVRGGKDDRVHVRIRQRLRVRLMEGEAVRRAERFVVVGLRPRRRRDKLQVLAHALHGLDQRLPPPAEPDHRRLDHFAIRSSEKAGSAA